MSHVQPNSHSTNTNCNTFRITFSTGNSSWIRDLVSSRLVFGVVNKIVVFLNYIY